MKYLLSIGVFIGITSIVVSSAGYIVERGISNNSNIELASKYLDDNKLKQVALASEAKLTNSSEVLGVETDIVEESNLVSQQKELYLHIQTRSVADFLRLQGIDYSYEYRSQLAEKYSIYEYTGTKEQNNALLEKLKSEVVY